MHVLPNKGESLFINGQNCLSIQISMIWNNTQLSTHAYNCHVNVHALHSYQVGLNVHFRGGLRSSGKGVHVYEGVGVRFADLTNFS